MLKSTSTVALLFISGFCSLALGSSDFHLIDILKNYSEAKSYCRETYNDLASVQNSTDMNNLITLVASAVDRAWIGLESEGVWKWHWSSPHQRVDFLNWRAGEPQKLNQDRCAVMDTQGKWFESDCTTRRRFVCRGNGNTIFVSQTESWRNAQDHCRGLSSELVSIQSADENESVRNVSQSQNVWIGLFKDPWKWSDGSESTFRFWKASQPNYLDGQNCTAAIFKDTGQWNDLRCVTKRRFVCRGARKPTTPATFTTHYLTTTPGSTSQIITFPFTVVTGTERSTTTHVPNVTTNNITTATSAPTTPDATDNLSSTSSTKPNNATTEMSIVTTTQTLTTSVQAITESVPAITTQSVAHSSTVKPTEDSQGVTPANLILIQENMTWIEALSYCRKRHLDLVHVTTRHIQAAVEKKVENATSSHIWLGLRYTCNFNFWSWISSTTGCYQNWAPGHGSQRRYDCGVTGAIEATGRQQWVGLPDTERLNFVCSTCAG